MLPAYLLSCRAEPGGVAVPDYLSARDYPWLRELLDTYAQLAGRRRRALVNRLRDPLSLDSPRHKRLAAMLVLDRMTDASPRPAVRPSQARAAVFAAAASSCASAAEITGRVAADLGVTTEQLERALLADIPAERIVGELGPCSPVELALRCNLALAQGFVRRSSKVHLELCGNAHNVVRTARLRGLICLAQHQPRSEMDVRLDLSGPLALFRRTAMYGRALASLVPTLSWCTAFRMRACARVEGREVEIQIASGDPIFPSREPRRFDSQLEQRFARDFGRAAPDWELVREPNALPVGTSLVFPDFALRHRRDTTRSWLLEIVGFWTPRYLEHKLRALREARVDNLIVCIDETLNCAEGDLPASAHVVPYRKRIDPARVLAIVDPFPPSNCKEPQQDTDAKRGRGASVATEER